MAEYKKLKGVARACGDYVAFHEMSLYVEWVFGHVWYLGDMISEQLCDALECDWEDLRKQDKAKLDSLVYELLDKEERDYCDVEVQDVLALVESDDTVKEVWVSAW